MPIEQHVDEKSGIMHVRRWGAITTHDEAAALNKRREDPRVVPNIPVIVDRREVDPADTTELVQYLASRVTALAADLDCGPVDIVGRSDVECGMARMYTALTELNHPHTNVFRSYDDANGCRNSSQKRIPDSMFEELCRVAGKKFEPCLAAGCISTVRFVEGGAPRKWWEYTKQPKRHSPKSAQAS